MSRDPGTPLAIELAGQTWVFEGIDGDHLGHLRPARVEMPDECPNTISLIWRDRPGHRQMQKMEGKFDIFFDYGEAEVSASGPLFNARIFVQPELRADVEILSSAGIFVPGIIENVLRILTAYRTTMAGGLLLHSACFARNGRAWVVFGHSGAGKSTCSRFASEAGFDVLSDDINILYPGKQGWHAQQVPFAGSFQTSWDGPAAVPVEAVCWLRQSPHLELRSLSPATALATLFASAAFVNEDPWRSEQLSRNCERLSRELPVAALHFRRDSGFLQLLTGTPDAQAVA